MKTIKIELEVKTTDYDYRFNLDSFIEEVNYANKTNGDKNEKDKTIRDLLYTLSNGVADVDIKSLVNLDEN